MNASTLSLKIFAALLKLYPPSFRSEFAEEMEAVFTVRLRDQATDGGFRLALACLGEYLDISYHLLLEYLALIKMGVLVSKLSSGNFQSNLVWRGILVFGMTYGLGRVFGLANGLPTTGTGNYHLTIFQIILSIVTGFVIWGVPTGILWQSAQNLKNKWGFLPIVLGMIILNLLTLGISERIDYSHAPNLFYWWEVMVGWPLSESMMSGLTFGGLFGWFYKGRQGIVPFGLTCMVAMALGDVVTQVSIFLSAVVYHIAGGSDSLIYQNVGFIICLILLEIISGMILGALLGWQIDQANKKEPDHLVAI